MFIVQLIYSYQLTTEIKDPSETPLTDLSVLKPRGIPKGILLLRFLQQRRCELQDSLESCLIDEIDCHKTL